MKVKITNIKYDKEDSYIKYNELPIEIVYNIPKKYINNTEYIQDRIATQLDVSLKSCDITVIS